LIVVNINKEKQLTFGVQIEGVAKEQIKSKLTLVFTDIEYSFPGTITDDTIVVNIPPLNKILSSENLEKQEVDAKLEIVADNRYFVPWSDQLKLSGLVVVKAQVKETASSEQITMKLKKDLQGDVVQEKTNRKPQQSIKEFVEKLSEEDILKFIQKSTTKNPQIQQIILEQARTMSQNRKPIDILIKVIEILNISKRRK